MTSQNHLIGRGKTLPCSFQKEATHETSKICRYVQRSDTAQNDRIHTPHHVLGTVPAAFQRDRYHRRWKVRRGQRPGGGWLKLCADKPHDEPVHRAFHRRKRSCRAVLRREEHHRAAQDSPHGNDPQRHQRIYPHGGRSAVR